MIIIGFHGTASFQLISYIFKPEGIQIALKYKKFKEASSSTVGKLQALFNKQRHFSLQSNKIKEFIGIILVSYFKKFSIITFNLLRCVVYYSKCFTL